MRQFMEICQGFRSSTRAVACILVLIAAASAAAQTTAPSGEIPLPARPPSTQPAAIIQVDNIEHDFGDQWVGPEYEHSFTISNGGQVPLEILGTRADCSGCTQVGEYPKTIAPGESAKLPVTLRSVTLNGRVRKNLTLYSNDPVTKELTLRLLGSFKKRIDVQPLSASFGTLITSDPVNRVIKIKNNMDKPLQLKLQPVPTDRFTFNLVETEAGKAWDLDIKTVVPYQPGILQAIAVLETDVEDEKIIRVGASGRVPDRLDLFPTVANYVRPSQPMPGQTHGGLTFWLTNYGASLVNVTEATVDDPAVSVKVETRSPGKGYYIRVEIPFHAVVPPEGRTLTVRTDDPEKPTIQAKIVAPQSIPQVAQAPQQPNTPTQKPPNPATLMAGKGVPAFSLTTIDGKTVSEKDLSGQVTVLDFFAPNCGFCAKQLPRVEAMRPDYEAKGVKFLNVSMTMRTPFTREAITAKLEQLGIKGQSAIDENNAVGAKFSVASFPTLFVVGKSGKIEAVNVGNSPDLEGKLKEQLDGLISPGQEKGGSKAPHS